VVWRGVIFCFSLISMATNLAAQVTSSSQPEFDSSGKGAVLCTWFIIVDVRNAIDACFPSEFGDLRVNLTGAIDKTNDFIVANSPTPVTKEELNQVIAKRLAEASAQVAMGGSATGCKSRRDQFIEPMARQSRDDFHRWLADFLSVPRKPLMNPCL